MGYEGYLSDRMLMSRDALNRKQIKIKIIEEDLNEVYDWSSDVMHRKWDPAKALEKIKNVHRRNRRMCFLICGC